MRFVNHDGCIGFAGEEIKWKEVKEKNKGTEDREIDHTRNRFCFCSFSDCRMKVCRRNY